MTINIELVNQINLKLKKLNKNLGWQEILYPWLRTNITYSSNFIEGSTLTLLETSLVINDNISVGGKNMRELFEAKNHALAWDWAMENIILNGKKTIQKSDILTLHSFILKNIDEINAGKFRAGNVRISGSVTLFPSPTKVYDLVIELMGWLENQNTEDIIKTAMLMHLKLVKIHPFSDGNGRTCRLVSNCILMQNGLPPIDIVPENRLEYLMSLEKSTSQNPQPFLDFLLKQYNDNLDQYLETFEGTN